MAIKINNLEQLNDILKENSKVFMMKHSETCPVSLNAFDQYNNFLYERDIDGYYMVVQDSPEFKTQIAHMTSIQHESPQVIYFVNGEPVWHANHHNITISSLSQSEE